MRFAKHLQLDLTIPILFKTILKSIGLPQNLFFILLFNFSLEVVGRS